jgi:hypothetical protein
MFPASVRGIPAKKFFHHGDRDGELFSGGEFPVVIPTCSIARRRPFLFWDRLAFRARGWTKAQWARASPKEMATVVERYSVPRLTNEIKYSRPLSQSLSLVSSA